MGDLEEQRLQHVAGVVCAPQAQAGPRAVRRRAAPARVRVLEHRAQRAQAAPNTSTSTTLLINNNKSISTLAPIT
jgi:hypothetical protein